MHIYAKQCEIMQKKSMKEVKRPNSLFLQGGVVKKLARPKSTTFSESSGPELSHGGTLDRV